MLRIVPAPPPDLSPRQLEVLYLASQGLQNAEIGKRLFIAPNTVKTMIRLVHKKLGADNRCHAVAIAMRCNLFSRDQPPTNRPDCMHVTWADVGDTAARADQRTIKVANMGYNCWAVRHCGRWLSTQNTWDRIPTKWRPTDWVAEHSFLYSNAIDFAERAAVRMMEREL